MALWEDNGPLNEVPGIIARGFWINEAYARHSAAGMCRRRGRPSETDDVRRGSPPVKENT